MNKLIFGFDPGNSSGAVIALSSYKNTPTKAESYPFPVIVSKKSTGRTSKELDILKVEDWCILQVNSIKTAQLLEPIEFIFICEKVNAMPKQGSVSTFSFGDGYGQIKSFCRTTARKLNGKFILVRPQEWKALLLKGTPKDKGAGEQFIKDRYPQIDLHCNRNGKPHLGVVDAACIALYGLHNS